MVTLAAVSVKDGQLSAVLWLMLPVFLTAHISLKEIPLGAESIAALITPSTEPIVWHWPRIKGT